MRHEIPGRLGNMKRNKKCGSSTKASDKTAPARRKDGKRPKTRPNACDGRPASPAAGRLSRISCECHRQPDRTRCAASPTPQDECEGKENEADRSPQSRDSEGMEDGAAGEIFFPDDDSNQILPVEQFFGNLDTVQDCPLRVATVSTWGRRERRRRHYYAREESDEEEGARGGMQQDGRGGS